jgi:hypothetical protein
MKMDGSMDSNQGLIEREKERERERERRREREVKRV